MDEKLQLITFGFSFIYGILFGISLKIHYRFIEKYNIVFKYLTTIILVIDVVLGYLLGMYKLNQGIFHIYFLLIVFLGFGVSFSLQKKCKVYFLKRKDKVKSQ